jgi:hypothetical protein
MEKMEAVEAPETEKEDEVRKMMLEKLTMMVEEIKKRINNS